MPPPVTRKLNTSAKTRNLNSNMTTTQEIALKNAICLDGYNISVIPEALAAKQELLAAASQIVTVSNDGECVVAKTWISRLAALRIDVEKTRKKLKEIPLEAGRAIDGAAGAFLREPVDEENRLKRLVAGHAERIAAEAAAARAERARLAADAERQRQAAAAAELSRLAAIAKAQAEAEAAVECARIAAAAADAPDAGIAADIAAAEAYDAAADAARERAEIERQNAAAAAQDRANAALAASESEKARQAASQTVTGTSQYWDFEVINLRALMQFSHDRDMEFTTITANRAAILAELKLFPIDGNPPVIPGLSIVRKVRVR
jgi:hypothetical protein